MSSSVKELLAILDLEPIEQNLFRGRSPETAHQRVFGGQVAAQALVAAGRTVEASRAVHSLHAYFIKPGDPAAPLIYAVDPVRDGRSFTTRRVVARQHNVPIFVMSASFQVEEDGFDHADTMPEAPNAETLPEIPPSEEMDPRHWNKFREAFGSVDIRYVDAASTEPRRAHPAGARVWIRVSDRLPDDALLHVCVLAYLSDLTLLAVTLAPHGVPLHSRSIQGASLDHALWFHRPFRADEWLLYDQISPTAVGGRGLAAGRIFTTAGAHAATVMQEGLIRRRTPDR